MQGSWPVPGVLFHVLVFGCGIASLVVAGDPTIQWYKAIALLLSVWMLAFVLALWWVAGLVVVLDLAVRRSPPVPWRRLVAAPLVAAAVMVAAATDSPLRWRLAWSRSSLDAEIERVTKTPREDDEMLGRWVGAFHVKSVTEVDDTVRFGIGDDDFLVWSRDDPSVDSELSCDNVAGDWHLCAEVLGDS